MTGREPWHTSPTVLAIATNTFLVTVFVDDRSFIYFSSVCGSLAFTLESLWSILINAGVWVGNDGGMMCVKFLVDWARLSYGYWHFLGSSSSSCCSSENVGREWYVIIIVCPYIYE